jgi:hypothetical protein
VQHAIDADFDPCIVLRPTIAGIEVGPWRDRNECRDDDSVGVSDEGSEGMVFGEGRIAREQGIPEFIRRKHGEWGEAK